MSERYAGKMILAPMVRVGTLPMRLLSLDYGADLVYCEEIIDRKILTTTRTENDVLGTIDYTMSDGTVVFRTCEREKDHVIFQMGTSDAKRALAAAKKVENDVAGIDINMGCPKEFSIKGGMGCALLSQPDKIQQILTTLVGGVSIPVTCKIRVLPELEETLKLAKMIESTGVAALAVHGRTKDERPRHKNRNHVIKVIAETLSIPVIANGGSKEILQFPDIERFREDSGASSVMIARRAEWNCSIFRREGKLPLYDVIRDYLKYAFRYNNNDINTKYCVLQMMHEDMDKPEGEPTLSVKTNEEMSVVWGMEAEYQKWVEERKKLEAKKDAGANHGFKRRRADDGLPLIELPVRFDRKCYLPAMSPKQSLHEWCKQGGHKKPLYATVEHPEERSFHCKVQVEAKWYTTPFWEKNKQYAEQAAATCCLLTLGVHDGRIKEVGEQTPELRQKWRQLAEAENASPTANNSKGTAKTNSSASSEKGSPLSDSPKELASANSCELASANSSAGAETRKNCEEKKNEKEKSLPNVECVSKDGEQEDGSVEFMQCTSEKSSLKHSFPQHLSAQHNHSDKQNASNRMEDKNYVPRCSANVSSGLNSAELSSTSLVQNSFGDGGVSCLKAISDDPVTNCGDGNGLNKS